MAVFYLQHTGKGKAAYDRQGLVNHARYVLRKSACIAMGTHHMPNRYGNILGWIGRVYDTSRKNARVVDSIIVNLPRELSHGQHVQLVRDYLHAVSQGRTPYLYAIHGDKPDNPHAHIIIRDADIDTGKRVAGLSKAGSSYRLRVMWEQFCNRALAEYGVAISRWGKNSKHHAEVNQRARMAQETPYHAAHTALTSPQSPQTPPMVVQPVVVDTPEQEVAPMADAVIKQEAATPTISAVAAFVANQVTELDRLQASRAAILDYRAKFADLTRQIDRAVKRMVDIDAQLAGAMARERQAEMEAKRHKGLFNRLWQLVSPAARQQAKAARSAMDMAIFNLSRLRIEANSLTASAKAMQSEKTALTTRANALKAELAVYGSDADLDNAERVIQHTIKMNMAELTAAELSQALVLGHITPEQHRKIMRHMETDNGISQ